MKAPKGLLLALFFTKKERKNENGKLEKLAVQKEKQKRKEQNKVKHLKIKIQELRDSGKKAHSDGDHSESEKLLNEALSLINS